MARQLRIQYPGAIYHVMNRGDRREAIFREDADREALLAAPAEACSKTARRRCQPPPDSLKKINMTLSRTDPFTEIAWHPRPLSAPSAPLREKWVFPAFGRPLPHPSVLIRVIRGQNVRVFRVVRGSRPSPRPLRCAIITSPVYLCVLRAFVVAIFPPCRAEA